MTGAREAARSRLPGVTVLVIGSGGREHALAWKLASSPKVARMVVAPGNDAWPAEWERWGDWKLETEQFAELALRAKQTGVDLVVVGPDQPLADGLVDVLTQAGVRAFGPTKSAAKLEASKAFAKDVMRAAGVPTAKYRAVDSLTDALEAVAWVSGGCGRPAGEDLGCVVKADGLALGKGVRVCATRAEGEAACRELIGVSGQLVIEEKLDGEEISWMAFCDGERCALLEPARDHKRLCTGDQGPNTGGMGAYSPVPGVPVSWSRRMREEVFIPVLREMKNRGTPFRGILYAGLMADPAQDRFWVLEFNARFGDPETQVLLPRIADDLLDWCEACARGDLSKLAAEDVRFHPEAAVVVVGAAEGYPGAPRKGVPVPVTFSPPMHEGVPEVFWAGVARAPRETGLARPDGGAARLPDEFVTAGGRVFGAMGFDRDMQQARALAYVRAERHRFPGMQLRKDIGPRT